MIEWERYLSTSIVANVLLRYKISNSELVELVIFVGISMSWYWRQDLRNWRMVFLNGQGNDAHSCHGCLTCLCNERNEERVSEESEALYRRHWCTCTTRCLQMICCWQQRWKKQWSTMNDALTNEIVKWTWWKTKVMRVAKSTGDYEVKIGDE